MSRKQRHARAAFTLLELVVVLAILAVVTTLAIRSLDGLEDQSRYEKNVRGFEELSAAVLGSPDDRAADGTRTVSGFVADMGRLPKAVADENGNLTLAELWEKPQGVDKFDVRQAIANNCTPSNLADEEVVVPGGWRGPYLRLPIGATAWLDGWGNPMSSPAASLPDDPYGIGYARLRNRDDDDDMTAGQEIRIIRHLGADGRVGPSNQLYRGYDKDGQLDFNETFSATLTVQVEVLKDNSAAQLDLSDRLEVRVFSPRTPNSNDLSMIGVTQQIKSFETTPPNPPLLLPLPNPVTVTFHQLQGLTVGPRVIRAYFTDAGIETTSYRKSTVKHITLRPGANIVTLTIDR